MRFAPRVSAAHLDPKSFMRRLGERLGQRKELGFLYSFVPPTRRDYRLAGLGGTARNLCLEVYVLKNRLNVYR